LFTSTDERKKLAIAMSLGAWCEAPYPASYDVFERSAYW